MTALIPTKEVARRKGVTVKTVNQWAASKKLDVAEVEPFSKARLFDPEVVDKFNPLDPTTFALESYTTTNEENSE